MTEEPTDEQIRRAAEEARRRIERTPLQDPVSASEVAGVRAAATAWGTCPECGRDREMFEAAIEPPPGVEIPDTGCAPGYVWGGCQHEAEDEIREWEAERNAARAQALRDASHLPSRLAGMTLERFVPGDGNRDAYRAAREYAARYERMRESGSGMILSGGVGTGKTHLIVGLMRVLIEEHRAPCLFVVMPELLNELRPGGHADPHARIRQITTAEVLFLDDLGSERPTDWTRELVFLIVNRRYVDGLPTVATTNLGPGELRDALGNRTASRIGEMCRWVLVEGDDRRRAG